MLFKADPVVVIDHMYIDVRYTKHTSLIQKRALELDGELWIDNGCFYGKKNKCSLSIFCLKNKSI